MSNLTDRASFLKGLAQGMQLNKDTNEGKLLSEIIDVIGEMAKEMEKLQEAYDELNEYVESIDDDLADMEEVIFGDEEECYEDDDEDGDIHDDEESGDTISYSCPHCNHEMEFSADDVDFSEDMLCPACKKPVFPVYEPEDDDEDEDDEE